MYRTLFALLTLCWAASAGRAADGPSIKFPSPDGRFALRITAAAGDDSSEPKVELIEKASGKVMVDLGTAYTSHLRDTVLVWSANSRRAAYGTRDNREGETSVYFWNGSAFDEITLPENMPGPHIDFGKHVNDSVKNYGGGTKPVRWLKSGDLELSSDSTMMSRENSGTYTGVVVFTLTFDAKHHASVQSVGKTKTRVDK